jgi:hypothetical protein
VIKVNIEGVDAYQINLVRGDTKREYSFDASTGLLKREMLSLAGVVHTTDHLQYATAKNGVKYPTVSTYFNTKDKRKTALTTEWIFDVLPTASMFSK